MPNELHYTSYIFNNSENYLDMGMNKTLFHDGKKIMGSSLKVKKMQKKLLKKLLAIFLY